MRIAAALSLPLFLALAACGESTPKCETEADMTKLQIDIESKLQKLAIDDQEKAMKIAEEMMTAGLEVDFEKAMSGDVSELCAVMTKAWAKLN